MSEMVISLDTPVDELLRYYPQASHILIQHHINCVGCRFGKFCTVGDLVANYGVDLAALSLELAQSTHPMGNHRS